MNVIFLTMVRITGIEVSGIYQDLMRKFRDEGHDIYIVTPSERQLGLKTSMTEDKGVHILNVWTLNLQKTSVVEKGIGQVLVEGQYKRAIKNYLKGVKFDLILYSTPPITFPNVIAYLKRQNPQAMTYLLLKDIVPQNAVDLGMLQGMPVQGSWFKVHGWGARAKYQLYKYFRRKEKKLYAYSDYIGCMSPANVEFVLKHNPEVDAKRVEVAPNCLELKAYSLQDRQEKAEWYYIRKKYNLPTDKPIFIYGGNLGKPQGIDYLIKCLDANKDRTDCHFVVVGTGTEYDKLDSWFRIQDSGINVTVMNGLPKEDYDMLVKYCDVGLIFLDHRFTIPNYPSRLLSYLEYKIPVICATDPNTDMGRIAEENGYGYWCESVKPEDFTALVDKMQASDRKAMGEKGYEFLKENYLVEHTYKAIMKHINI
jgi:glycosyltransferase involved in cell wall biosynthesis